MTHEIYVHRVQGRIARNLVRGGGANERVWGTEVPSGVQGQSPGGVEVPSFRSKMLISSYDGLGHAPIMTMSLLGYATDRVTGIDIELTLRNSGQRFTKKKK